MLGVVLEQGVSPCGTVAGLVGGVGGSRSGAAPDGRAAGGVGDIHLIAEQLGYQAGISGLGAACAGTGELEQRSLVLAADNGAVCNLILDGDVCDHVIEYGLLRILALTGDHLERIGRADAYADAAAHAVEGRNSEGVFVDALALACLLVDDSCALRSVGSLFFGQKVRADSCVRADEGALVALCAGLCVPLGNHDRDAALLIGGCALLECAVCVINKDGNRERIAVHKADRSHDGVDHLDELLGAVLADSLGSVNSVSPVRGNVDLDVCGSAGVDSLLVHLDYLFALLHELLGLLLHVADSLFLGKNLGKGEECGLKNGVGALAQTDLCRDINSVDGVELNVVLGYVALSLCGHLLVELISVPLAVDEENAAGLNIVDHLVALLDIGGVVAGNEVSLVDIVGALYRVVAETKVGDGDTARLLRVILEVSLNVLVGVVADDLDGVLVRADCAVAAETPELALDGAGSCGVGSFLLLEGQVGNIIVDADSELVLGLVLLELVIDSEHA